MKNLVFRIDLKRGALPVTDGEVSLGLSMPGMTMAPNTVTLAHRGGGMYEGRGVIVKCPSGDGSGRPKLGSGVFQQRRGRSRTGRALPSG